MTSVSSKRRVKVYELTNQGQWADLGTGICYCTYLEVRADDCECD